MKILILIWIAGSAFLSDLKCQGKNNAAADINKVSLQDLIKDIYIYKVATGMDKPQFFNNNSTFYILNSKNIYKIKSVQEAYKIIQDTLGKTDLRKNIEKFMVPEKYFNSVNTFGIDDDGERYGVTITLYSGKTAGFHVMKLKESIVPDDLKPLMKEVERGVKLLGIL